MELAVLPAIPGQALLEQVERPQTTRGAAPGEGWREPSPHWEAALGSLRMWNAVDRGCCELWDPLSCGMLWDIGCCGMLQAVE